MSKLLSDHIKIVLSVVVALGAFLFVPTAAEANTCSVMAKSFRCMSGIAKKKTVVKKSYQVASISPTRTISDAGPSVMTTKSKPKARVKVRATKKRVKRRSARKKRIVRRSKKTFRKNKSLRKIGRRLNARSVRKLSRRGSAKTNLAKRGKSSKRGWRTRSKGLGFAAANRGVSTSCFPPRLRKLLKKVSNHYGRKLRITSGYRSHRHNRRIGGARRSQHLHCTAADFYVPGVNKYTLARYLKGLAGRGGVGTYSGNRIVHLDVGPRRTWHWGGRKRRAKRRYIKKRRISRVMRARQIARKRRMATFRGSMS